MRLGEDQVKERGISIELETCANDSDVSGPVPLERELVREVALVDKDAIVRDALGLEATVLESHIGRVLQDHIAACCNSGHILKVLAHQTVATTGVGGVAHIELTLDTCRVTRLLTKEVLFLRTVLVQILGAKERN